MIATRNVSLPNAQVRAAIPTKVKLAYGLGELGPAMAGSTLIFFQLVFLTDVAGLAAGLAGTVLLVGKIWDALNDPMIGMLSDRTKSRFGRRLPWMMGSAIPFAILFFLLWWAPPFLGTNQWLIFAYFVGIAILFNTAYTALALPHTSLTPELSSDYDERSKITGFRMACSLAGSVGGLVIAAGIFSLMSKSNQAVQFGTLGAAVSIVGLLSCGICIAGIFQTVLAKDKERRDRTAALNAAETEAKAPGFLTQLKIVASNKPFVLVCGIYLFSWLAMQFTATVLPYYVQTCMGLPREQFTWLALTVQVTALAMIPFWSWVSVRFGKKQAYFAAMPMWLAAQAGLLFLQTGQTTIMYALAFAAGFGISVCYLVPNAMVPDTIELDELRTGERREGIFYGFFVFLQKLALALGTAVIGFTLQAAGYLSSTPGMPEPIQPESAVTAIRLAIGPLPAVSLILGIILTALYPITKERHAET